MAVTLTKETGAVVTGANTYVNENDFDNYCDGRGLSYSAYTPDQKEEAILRGMDYIENLEWKGTKQDEDNPLQWPRDNVEDRDGNVVDDDVVPTGIMNASCRAAYEELIDTGTLLTNLTRDDLVKRETIGPITTEFFEFANTKTVFQTIHAHCREYLVSGGKTLLRV